MSQGVTLETVPIEIVQRIAGYLSVGSVFNLLRVSRKIRDTCDEELVFKSVIENGNGDPTARPWNIEAISHQQTGWISLAVADSWARSMSVALPWDTWNEYSFSAQAPTAWAPHMVALHHPFVADTSPRFLFRRRMLGHEPGPMNAFDFVLGAIIMHRLAHGQKSRHSEGEVIVDIESEVYKILHVMESPVIDDGPDDTFCLQVVCSFVYLTNYYETRVLAPVPLRIPFGHFMRLPSPFTPTHSFTSAYLPLMTSAAFLSDGEWVGGSITDLDMETPRNATLPSVIEGLSFVLRNKSPGVLSLIASGTEDDSPISIEGIASQSGSVELWKTGSQDGEIVTWTWHLNMTPFGMMGTSVKGHDKMYIWLWKRDWSYG